jgi:hypothetical protein
MLGLTPKAAASLAIVNSVGLCFPASIVDRVTKDKPAALANCRCESNFCNRNSFNFIIYKV